MLFASPAPLSNSGIWVSPPIVTLVLVPVVTNWLCTMLPKRLKADETL